MLSKGGELWKTRRAEKSYRVSGCVFGEDSKPSGRSWKILDSWKGISAYGGKLREKNPRLQVLPKTEKLDTPREGWGSPVGIWDPGEKVTPLPMRKLG